MAIDIVVPALGESITEATVSKWLKKPGETINLDEAIVELETDKVAIEVNAPCAGILSSIIVEEGSDVAVGATLGSIDAETSSISAKSTPVVTKIDMPSSLPPPEEKKPVAQRNSAISPPPLSPAVRKLVDDNDLDPRLIIGTGKDGRISKGDALSAIAAGAAKHNRKETIASADEAFHEKDNLSKRPKDSREERTRMTKLRKVIARRLKEAQNTAAALTTWNEVDMGAAMELRATYRDAFEKKHGVRLGFMAFFVRAACIALKEWPAVNAEIYGDEFIYKNYYNIGVAVGTPNGLVVPVIKDADQKRFAEIEGLISDFGHRARDGKLSIDEMMGGTFTISNGGVFGSLNSMPILNMPQSAILGMHKIQKRPIVINDEVIIRPMMYLALSYDHRIIDGREAVSFLVRMKECLEDPQRIMLDV
ncbi:MAG: dihydrolipoyllysine-residue succinyltransferase [Magnetovibrio sp.]|nr:dihydrolipoyllysine-residue succinyltransferase [Magnetovibrio sp.]